MEPMEQRMHDLLNQFSDKLPNSDIETAREYIEYREWGVAFEFLCTQLDEYDTEISPDVFLILKGIGVDMGIDPKYWTHLDPSGPKQGRIL